jgi:hypothetical protein
MDWNSLIAKTKDFTEKAKPLFDKTKLLTQKASPLIQRARNYGSDAIAFVGKQVEQTPMFLRTEEEYNLHHESKRSILIAYDSRDTLISEKVRISMPIWATQAWTDAAELKYIEISTNEDLAKLLGISGTLEMRVAYAGEDYERFSTFDAVKNWWQIRNYIHGDTDTTIESRDKTIQETPILDPLREAEKKPKIPRKKKIAE